MSAEPAADSRSPGGYGIEMLLRLTLVYLLLKPVGEWWARVPLVALAALGLLFPRFFARPGLWWGLAGLSLLRVAHGWAWVDNHAFLLTYWLLAVALYRVAGDDGDLAANARLLVGASFALAVLWKVALSGDFLSGDFFHANLLTDGRFRHLALLGGLVTPEQWEANMASLGVLRRGAIDGIELLSTARLPRFAALATWWTVALEAAVAVAFTVPTRLALSRSRDALLLLFAWSTYPFATVAGFGWLLMILGLAQCPLERRVLRAFYLVSFFAILVMRDVPWTHLLYALRGG